MTVTRSIMQNWLKLKQSARKMKSIMDSLSDATNSSMLLSTMMKHAQLQMISTLQVMDTDNGLKQGSITTIAKRFDMAHSMVYRLWECMVCTFATGVIISPEYNSWKKVLGGHLFIQQSLFKRVSRKCH